MKLLLLLIVSFATHNEVYYLIVSLLGDSVWLFYKKNDIKLHINIFDRQIEYRNV